MWQPPADEAVPVRVMSSALRQVLRMLCVLVGVALVAVAAWIGMRDLRQLELYAPALGAGRAVALMLGRGCGMVAAVLVMLQLALASRVRLLDQAFGLDRLLRAHRYLGATALALVVLHPALLFLAGVYHLGELSLKPWPVVLGQLALLLMTVVVVASIWRLALGIPYHIWRRGHYAVFVVVVLVGVHSLVLGSDLQVGWPRLFWLALLAGYVLLFLWTRVARPLCCQRWYDVAQVNRVSPNAWEIVLTARGRGLPPNLPGQFAFLRLRRAGRLEEEHPFTICSAPTGSGLLRFVIKESGDYTATIGATQPGDAALVAGPYGIFSHLLHGGGDLLMIGGGVGITPLLSMLRYLAAVGDRRHLKLIWGNRTEADVVLGEEIRQLQERLDLTVVHVLSRQEDFDGPTGHLTRDLLATLLEERDLRAEVYLCGPPPMMTTVQRALRALGVPARAIHSERFAL